MSLSRALRTGVSRSTFLQASTKRGLAGGRVRYQSTDSAASSSSGAQNTHEQPNTRRTTHFGFQTVDEDAKEDLVRGVFSNVAGKYDLMNDAMSLGVHRLWKDAFVAGLNPGRRGPLKCLDVAGGTGDIALRMLDHVREKYFDRETSVEVLDINPEMLAEGKKRFKLTMYHNSELE
jgi:2-methoxy-6-polyprenyl-1,4-benzoquinol methylase